MALMELALFPLFSVVFALLAIFIGYGIAVAKGHVDAWLPFISDCGAIQPESSIFGQLFNLSALFLAITVYFIHRETLWFYSRNLEKDIGKWKIFSAAVMIIGWVAALGASIVANFQEGPQLQTHNVGAFLYFIGITVYFSGLLVMAYVLRPRIVSIHLTNLRFLLTLLTAAVLIFHIIYLIDAPFVKKVNGQKPKEDVPPSGIVRHKKGDPFYTNWLATTISEWVLALLILLHILSYCYDLAVIRTFSPTLLHNYRLDHDNAAWSDSPSEQVRPQQDVPLGSYYGSPSSRALYRVDQSYSYVLPRALSPNGANRMSIERHHF